MNQDFLIDKVRFDRGIYSFSKNVLNGEKIKTLLENVYTQHELDAGKESICVLPTFRIHTEFVKGNLLCQELLSYNRLR